MNGAICVTCTHGQKKQKEKEVNSADEPVQWQIMEEKKREATEQRPVHNVQGDGYSIWYDLRKSHRSEMNTPKNQVNTVC